MKFAMIAASRTLYPLMKFASYHMALGQELLRDPDYARVYRQAHRKGDFVIVDNGAAENDTPPFEEIVSIADYIKADEIVMPDVMRDAEATIRLLLTGGSLNLVEPTRRLVVPHGSNAHEWLACFSSLVLGVSFATVGIPKYTEEFHGGRRALVEAIHQACVELRVNIHMLGVKNDLHKETLGLRDKVRGIDSGLPIALAQQKRFLISGTERASLQWNADCDVDIARDNILMAMEWCANESKASPSFV